MKHLWQQQLCDRQPQPQQPYVSLFLFVAVLRWGIQCAGSQLPLYNRPGTVSCQPQSSGNFTLLHTQKTFPSCWKSCPTSQPLVLMKSMGNWLPISATAGSTFKHNATETAANSKQRSPGCANICNRSKMCLRRWNLFFFSFFFFLFF